MTKAPTPTENPKSNVTAQKTPPQTSITQRLRTVSWSNNIHPTGAVKSVNEHSTLPPTATAT